MDCKVVWCGAGEIDAALVRVTDSDIELPFRRHTVRWGRFATSTPRQDCALVGYPAFEGQGPDRERIPSQVTGRINPLTGSGTGRLLIDVDAAPADLGPDSSLWAGMSGAAVLCDAEGEILVAIARQDASHFESRRLAAVPIELCLADASFRRLVAVASGSEPEPELVDLTGLFAAHKRPSSPAALLDARSHTVGFRGRHAELARLRKWCTRDEGFSAHVIAGPGGQGKTRLAAHLVSELAGHGWVTGFVHEHGQVAFDALPVMARPALLVVDYAETRAATIAALTTATRRTEPPIRLLLLARSVGEWREDAAVDHGLEYLVHTPVLQLAALERTSAGRLTAWREAVRALAAALPQISGYEDTGGHADAVLAAPPPWLTEGLDGDISVLGIHIDALAALLTAVDPDTACQSPMDTLLHHEERYWKGMAQAREFRADSRTLAAAVAVSTLFAAATRQEAHALVTAMPGLGDMSADRHTAALHWLAATLPNPEGFWGTLQPDRLGEYHVARVLSDQPELPISLIGVASVAQRERALTVLARAAVDAPHLDALIRSVVAAAPTEAGPTALSVAVRSESPEPLLAGVREIVVDADHELLIALSDAIPLRTHVLRTVAVTVSERLVAGYRAAPEVGPELARALTILARRLRACGRFEDAVRVNREAVALLEQLTEPDDCAQLLDLGRALDSLADQLSRLGQLDESLEMSERSVAIARRIRTVEPGGMAHLAGSLNGLASRLTIVGRRGDAVAAAGEAVNIFRELTCAPGGEAYRPGLATALNLLGARLAGSKTNTGLAAIEEALQIRRDLAKANPDAYAIQLAATLNNLSNQHSRQGSFEDGLAASEEAVVILRRLAEGNPDAHHQDLAMALRNLCQRLAELGRIAEAVEASREYVRIRRQLADAPPDWRRTEGALESAASSLTPLGSMVEVVELAGEAVAEYRGLPENHLRLLARALQAQAEWLGVLRRTDEAVESMEEAVFVHRLLAQEDSGATLAGSLLRFAQFLQAAGREEAIDATREAIELRRELAAGGQSDRRSDLAGALARLADLLEAHDKRPEALSAMAEAVAIRRTLNAPTRLTGTLSLYADQLTRAGRYYDARNALLEAIKIQRRQRRRTHLRALGSMCRKLARIEVKLNQPKDAARAASEAVTTWRKVPDKSASDINELASCMADLVQIQETLGHGVEAASMKAEAAMIRRQLGVIADESGVAGSA